MVLLGNLYTQFHMRAFRFLIDRFADIMQQAGTTCHAHIGSDLGGQRAR